MTTATYDLFGFTRVVICFVLIAFTAGCTTKRPVNGTDAAFVSAKIEVGDKIEITRKDKSSVKFRVTAISDDGISGKGTFVAFSDIKKLQLQVSRKNTAGKIIAGVALGAAAVAIAPYWLMAVTMSQ